MRVIYKAPGCAPEPRDIPNTLEDLQATVGGYIDVLRENELLRPASRRRRETIG